MIYLNRYGRSSTRLSRAGILVISCIRDSLSYYCICIIYAKTKSWASRMRRGIYHSGEIREMERRVIKALYCVSMEFRLFRLSDFHSN